MQEEFDADTARGAILRGQLVCAYPLGFGVGIDTFSNGLIRPADGPGDVGACFVSFCTGSKHNHQQVALHSLQDYMVTQSPISHNPLTWMYNDDTEVPIDEHLGFVDKAAECLYLTPDGGFVSVTATQEGALRIDDELYRSYISSLGDADGEYHSSEVNLFWPNLRADVERRAMHYAFKNSVYCVL